MLEAREHVTEINKAPLIRALAALLMVIAILATTVRILTRLVTVGKLKLDDGLVVLSTVFAIVQSIVVIFEGANGLGKLDGLNKDQISSILKSQYASDILFISTLFLSKISTTRTIWSMAPRERERWVHAAEGVICLWAVGSISALLFQCDIPRPWDYIQEKCFNRAMFWTLSDSFNIVTDLIITGILFEIFRKLHTSKSKKFLVMSVFGCRILNIPAIICHIYYFRKASGSNNPMFHMWMPTVIVQVVQCMSIMSTCIPYLKPFMDSLESGQMNTGDAWHPRTKHSSPRARHEYLSGKPSIAQRPGLRAFASMASHASHRRQNYEIVEAEQWGRNQGQGTTATVTTSLDEGLRPWDAQSHTSQSVFIHQSWHVEVEEGDGRQRITR